MRLWSIQSEEAYKRLQLEGKLHGKSDYRKDDFSHAYRWMVECMRDRLDISFDIESPIWAWYHWRDAINKRPDLRSSSLGNRGESYVLLELEVPFKDVLLSDFILFHHVINKWYLPLDESDDELWYAEIDSRGVSVDKAYEYQDLRARIRDSWVRIFDLDREDDYLYYPISKRSIQATIPSINIEHIISSKSFIAR